VRNGTLRISQARNRTLRISRRVQNAFWAVQNAEFQTNSFTLQALEELSRSGRVGRKVRPSRKTKIALKKTIAKKSKIIKVLKKEMLDRDRLAVTEAIYADLLRLCSRAARGRHPEITIRFGLHGGTAASGMWHYV
jgi:hypothetical protein